jgi:hypothetical protein
MKGNILCRIFGHKWRYKPGDHLSKDPKDWFVEYCERCGDEPE